MRRRTVLCGLVAATFSSPSLVIAQFTPFALRLVRRTGWEELMGRNKCVIGDLYHSDPSFPISDLGTKLCNVLELPYRNNINEISAIPAGQYEGFIRTDGSRGWRIELKGTGSREHIQLHVGNRPKDTIGCLLPGTGDASDASCTIAGSKAAIQTIRDSYADSTNKRPVVLSVQA